MGDRIISIILVMFAIFYITATLNLPKTTADPIGLKGFPLLIASLLVLLSLVLLLKSFVPRRLEGNQGRGESKKNLYFVALAMIGYVSILNFIGFILSTFVFLITVLMLWNKRKIYANMAIAIITVLVSYILINALNISLPIGIFGFY